MDNLIHVETNNDKVINTTPIVIGENLEKSIEVVVTKAPLVDSDDDSGFDFLVNKDKVSAPKEKLPYKEEPKEQDTKSTFSENPPQSAPIFYSAPSPPPRQPYFPPLQQVQFESIKTTVMSDDDIRREKSFLLHQFESKNLQNRYSPKILSMNNSLDDIKNELEYINSKRDLENNMTNWKQGLFLGLNGLVQLNNNLDPFDVDLSDWLKDTHYELMRAGKYDEVLEELIIKWRGKIPIGPEIKLVGLMCMSLTTGIMAKKQEKRERQKREREEQLIDDKVDARMKQQFNKMQEQANNEMRTQQKQFQQQQQLFQQQQANQLQQQTNKMQQPPLTGPSLTEEEVLLMVKQDIEQDTEEIVTAGPKKRGRKKLSVAAVTLPHPTPKLEEEVY